ncbi:MAG: SLOG family protein [Oscillospiraceae bacterium]
MINTIKYSIGGSFVFCTISGRTVNDLPFGMDEKHPGCIQTKLMLANRIIEMIAYGVTDYFCNCEYGIPIWAAELILKMKSHHGIRLHIVMPHEEQASQWSDDVRERFFHIHETADSVKLISTFYHKNCYRQVDEYMADNSQLVFTDDRESLIAAYAGIRKIRVERLL